MAQRVADVVIVGTTGAGKSTLANLLVHGKSAPDDGFEVGDDGDAMTTRCRSETTSRLEGCSLQVTDTPGVPDTNRKKSLPNYDRIIKCVRDAPWLNAIIIMVEGGRKMEREYLDMRALMQQFNILRCAKIMVCRLQVLDGEDEERKRKRDAAAKRTMNRICDEAGLSFVRQTILHNTDPDEVNMLRELVAAMPKMPVPQDRLRTSSVIKTMYERLSNADTRRQALEEQVESLVIEITENEDLLRDLEPALDAELKKRRMSRAVVAAGCGAVSGSLAALRASAFVPLNLEKVEQQLHDKFRATIMQQATKLEAAIQQTTERTDAIREDLKRKRSELEGAGVDNDELRKAETIYKMLDNLSRDEAENLQNAG